MLLCGQLRLRGRVDLRGRVGLRRRVPRALAVPAGPQRIERMSVYSLNGWDCRLVQAFPLEGHAGRATPSPRG